MPVTASPPVLVSTIVTQTGDMLLDSTHVRWPVVELIRWVNEALSAVLLSRPEAFSTTDVFACVAGTLQRLPLGSAGLIDVPRNMAPDGVTPGRAVRHTDRAGLDAANPDWHTMPASGAVRHFVFDPRTPKEFYVYPPAVAGTKVEIKHVVMPPAVVGQDDALPIGPEYAPAVLNYVCYRCNLKDSEFANGQVSNLYYQAYMASLGLSPTGAAA